MIFRPRAEHNTSHARAAGPATEGDTMTATPRLDDRSKHLRRVIVRMLQCACRGHVGAQPDFEFCVVELFARPNGRGTVDERVTLSRCHCCIADIVATPIPKPTACSRSDDKSSAWVECGVVRDYFIP